MGNQQRNRPHGRHAYRKITIGLLLAISLYWALATDSVRALPAQPISSTVDVTEDVKAMGYPDGRKIARDHAGNLYVAYRKKYKEQLRTAYHIFVAKSVDNGRVWTVLNHGMPIEQTGDQNQRVPAIAIDSQDTIHVVWYGKDGNNYRSAENQIKYARSTDHGQNWSTWRNIGYIAGYREQDLWQEHPIIYIDPTDQLFVVWEGYDVDHPTAVQVKLIRSADRGQSWSRWQNVAPSSVNRSRPTIVGTAHGILYVLAYGRTDNRQQIVYTRSKDGGATWEQWLPVAPSISEQRHVSAVTDRQGNLHTVWRQQPVSLLTGTVFQRNNVKTQIYYADFDGHDWSKPLAIRANPAAAQTFPSIGLMTMDNDRAETDTVWVAWSETQGTYDYPNDTLVSGEIFAAAKTANGWQAPIQLASGSYNVYASLARIGSHRGGLDVVWLNNQPNLKRIQFAQIDPAVVLVGQARPNGLLSLQPAADTLIVESRLDTPYFIRFLIVPFLWNQQLTREAQTLLFIMVAVSFYVFLKFFISRWIASLTR